MKLLTKTIENKIYGYNTSEFVPVFVDGQLANQREFVRYKLKKARKATLRSSYKGFETFILAIDSAVASKQ